MPLNDHQSQTQRGMIEIDEHLQLLYVDDDSAFADLVITYLKRHDDAFDIHTESDPRAALEWIRENDGMLDCIISDYDMPGMDGIEFLTAVRIDFPDLPFILYTGKGSEEVASDAMAAGVDDYLQKEGSRDHFAVLANRISVLVAKRRTGIDLEKRVDQLQFVADLGQFALETTDLESIFRRATEGLQEVLGTDCTKILEYQPERGSFLLRAGVGWEEGLVGNATVGDGHDSQAGYTLRSARPVVVDDLEAEARFDGPDLLLDHDVVGGISVIIGTPDEPWGVLGTHTADRRRFSSEDISVVQNVATVLATAIHRLEREQRLTERTNQLEAILSHSTQPIFMKAETGEYLLVNQEYLDLFDLQRSDVLGHTDFELHADRLAEQVSKNDRHVIETDEPIEIEEQIEIDGEKRTYLTSKAPVRLSPDASAPDAILGIATDITDRKNRIRELEETNRRLDEFSSVVSHDLKNPLAIAQGRLELYLETGEPEHLEAVDDVLDRIHEIIVDLTTMARYGRAEIDPAQLSLDAVANDAWELIDSRDAVLEVTDTMIMGDRSLLQGMFENLFRNAVGHGGSAVTVRVGPLDDGFYVEDTGSGIPPEERDQVFEHGYTTGYSGSGIGLGIVERIATVHDFSVTLSESVEGGARFEFSRES